jgi:membrane associated rhomboid family serine protease
MTPAPVGLRCPDHSGKPQGIQKVTRAVERSVSGVSTRRVNAVTVALVAINVGVFLAELALGGNAGNGTGNWIYDKGVLFGPYIAQGDWWRLVTAAFLHYGPIHLAMNMYGLYLAGSLLEQVIGRWRFLLLYLASGIAGSAGALVLFVLERQRHIATGGQVAGLIVLNLVFTFAVSGISVGGHIGGLIGGVALMWVLLQVRRSTAMGLAAIATVIAVSVVIAYLKTKQYAP